MLGKKLRNLAKAAGFQAITAFHRSQGHRVQVHEGEVIAPVANVGGVYIDIGDEPALGNRNGGDAGRTCKRNPVRPDRNRRGDGRSPKAPAAPPPANPCSGHRPLT
jgi:hypothetical protein